MARAIALPRLSSSPLSEAPRQPSAQLAVAAATVAPQATLGLSSGTHQPLEPQAEQHTGAQALGQATSPVQAKARPLALRPKVMPKPPAPPAVKSVLAPLRPKVMPRPLAPPAVQPALPAQRGSRAEAEQLARRERPHKRRRRTRGISSSSSSLSSSASSAASSSVSLDVPCVRPTIYISTWGTSNLAGATRHQNEAALYIERKTADRRGAPKHVSDQEALNALAMTGHQWARLPTVVLDARAFYDPERSADTRWHIGTHPTIIARLLDNKVFSQWWNEAAEKCSQLMAIAPGPAVHVSVFCRAGEKRSVACAAVLEVVFKRLGFTVQPAQHLAAWHWRRRRNCAGDCEQCKGGADGSQTAEVVHNMWKPWFERRLETANASQSAA